MKSNLPHLAALAFGLAAAASLQAADDLPRLKLGATHTTVSGLSSGAYMAHQVHLAFSDQVAGAALIAGGPYHCAGGSLQTALGTCMAPAADAGPDLAALEQHARKAAAEGRIAALDGLLGDRVLILHGKADQTVAESLSRDTAALYRKLGARLADPLEVREDFGRAFTHTFPTLAAGSSCATATAPFVGHCGFDAAGEIFATLFGAPRHAVAEAHASKLRTFDQKPFRSERSEALLGDEGYLYVPEACAKGAACTLHIAFHGCQQNAETIGDTFAREAGYNRWADAHDVVVLYPQTRNSMIPLNPKGCWDWWGYGGADYDTRDGAQMQAVAAMAAALGAPLR